MQLHGKKPHFISRSFLIAKMLLFALTFLLLSVFFFTSYISACSITGYSDWGACNMNSCSQNRTAYLSCYQSDTCSSRSCRSCNCYTKIICLGRQCHKKYEEIRVCSTCCSTSYWECGYSYSSSSTETQHCGTTNGVAGNANKHVFLNTDTSYGSYKQCSTGNPDNTAFPPNPGTTVSWNCLGLCSGQTTGPYTAYRNLYPTIEDTVCPQESYINDYNKAPCVGNDCAQASTCSPTQDCVISDPFDYSEEFVNKKGVCYLPKMCHEIVGTGLQNELQNDDLRNSDFDSTYQIGTCPSTGSSFSLPTGYSNGDSANTNCVACIKVSDPWFQVVNGNLYANGDIKGSSTGKVDAYEVRGTDCSSNTDEGVGIPISSSDIKSLNSQIGNSKDINLSPGAVTIDKEDYDFFARSLGYLPEELEHNLKPCPNNLNSHNTNDFTKKIDSLVCYENSGLTLNQNLTVPNTESKIIFVNGDLRLKSQTQIASGGFLLFVVSGNIIIDPSLGHFPAPSDLASVDTSSCINPNETTIDLHGLFIADGTISIASGAGADNQSSYWHSLTYTNGATGGASCDKKLTLKGSFIGWGQAATSSTTSTFSSTKKGILISRTFTGCIKGFTHSDLTTPYISYLYDFNGSIPVVTFVYDINLVKAMPTWAQVSARLRQEVR